MKKKTAKILALLLAFSLLLGGCAMAAEEAAPGLAQGETFEDIEYSRPDIAEMEEAVARLQESLDRLSLPSTLRERIEDCYDFYYYYDTMFSLADIRNCQDMSDEFYQEEYAWCLENRPRVQQLMDSMYLSCAQSMYAPLMEKLFFWEGFMSQYGSEEAQEQPEEIYELYRRENQLINSYRSLIAQPYVELEGQSLDYRESLDDAQGEEFYDLVKAYYEQYNPLLGDIYAQLVSVRRQQAELLGYDSYEQMEYSAAYERDYSPQQAEEYLEDIKEYMVPLYRQLTEELSYSLLSREYMPQERLLEIMAQAAENMGEEIEESFRFMEEHRLYDIELRPDKAGISFQAYLSDYEAPFLFLSPYGDQSDVLSFAHEFGHFADAYVNYNAYETTDLAECFSQAMEYLALFYLEGAVDEETADWLMYYKALDTLDMYVGQAAISEFESRAYSLPQEELDAEGLNRLYMEVCRDYGLQDGDEELLALGWIDVPHLFENPFYVISYPVTNDVAMQIFALELEEPGQGLEKFLGMLPRSYENLLPSIEEAGLDSPFEEGRVSRALACLEPVIRSGKKAESAGTFWLPMSS